MRISSWGVIIALLFSKTVSAQTDSTGQAFALQYFNQLTSSGLFHKNGSSFSASTLHGVQYRNLGLGLGFGYDVYADWRGLGNSIHADWRAVPLFGSIVYHFAKIPRNSLFFQFNCGYSKVWMPAGNEWWNIRNERGRFINPMIGYKIRTNPWSIFLAAGYKFHRMKYDYTYRWSGPDANPFYVRQDIERVVLQLGIGLH